MPGSPPPTYPNDDFVQALTECQTTLRGYCQAALGHGEDAKDAWQRTNLKLWQKSADWQPGTPFLTWALAVSRFEVLATIRDKQRERLVFDTDVAELMADAAAEHAVAASQREVALYQCMKRLRPRQREVLTAHYLSGCTLAEIAIQQGMGLSAVKVLLLRVRSALAQCIGKHQPHRSQS